MKLLTTITVFLVLASLISCRTGPATQTVRIEATYLERQNPDYLQDQLASPNPDSGYLSIDRLFYENTRRSLREILRYGNYFLVSYPQDSKSAGIANRMAWASLFLVEELSLNSPNFFGDYGRNLEMFNRTIFYATKSELLDTRDHWNRRAAEFRRIVEQGFVEQSALFTYLDAQRLRRVDVMTREDYLEALREARQTLRDLQFRHPGWLPEIVTTDLDHVEQMLYGN